MLEAHLGERDAQAQLLQDQLVTAADKVEGLATQVRELELALAQSQAKVEAQQGIMVEPRAYLDGRERSTGSEARATQL